MVTVFRCEFFALKQKGNAMNGQSDQQIKLRKQIDEGAKLSRETTEKMLAEERMIKSLVQCKS